MYLLVNTTEILVVVMIFCSAISMEVFPTTWEGSGSSSIALPSCVSARCLTSTSRREWTALLGSLDKLFPANFFRTVCITSLTLLIETFMASRSMITSRTSSTYFPSSNVQIVSSSSKQVSFSNSLLFFF